MSSVWGTGVQYLSICCSQSNGAMEGRGTGSPTVVTAPRAFVHRYDGNIIAATDPAGSAVNNRYTSILHAGVLSYTPAYMNAVWNGGAGVYGPNDSHIMCGLGEGGTTTANWANFAGSVPPLANGLFGVLQLRLIDLIRNLPNPQILCILLDIGESDGSTTVTAPSWPTGMNSFYPALISMLTTPVSLGGLGLTFAKALRMILRILPDLAATGFTGWSPPASPNVQDLQVQWAIDQNAAQPNSIVTYKPNFSPFPVGYVANDNLHFSKPSLDTMGTGIGGLAVSSP